MHVAVGRCECVYVCRCEYMSREERIHAGVSVGRCECVCQTVV